MRGAQGDRRYLQGAGGSPCIDQRRRVRAPRGRGELRRFGQACRAVEGQSPRRHRFRRQARQATAGRSGAAVIAVLVTRPDGESDPLVHALRKRGYRVHAVPMVQTEPVEFSAASLTGFDWIVLTSARGVKALTDVPAGPKFAAVGPETARALRARGVEPSHVPGRADGADLGDTLPDVDGKRVALVRASPAGEGLPDPLPPPGPHVPHATPYRPVYGPPSSPPH